jgi:hypothetical protein
MTLAIWSPIGPFSIETLTAPKDYPPLQESLKGPVGNWSMTVWTLQAPDRVFCQMKSNTNCCESLSKVAAKEPHPIDFYMIVSLVSAMIPKPGNFGRIIVYCLHAHINGSARMNKAFHPVRLYPTGTSITGLLNVPNS